MAASKIRIKKICEYCGQEFYALKTSTRFTLYHLLIN